MAPVVVVSVLLDQWLLLLKVDEHWLDAPGQVVVLVLADIGRVHLLSGRFLAGLIVFPIVFLVFVMLLLVIVSLDLSFLILIIIVVVLAGGAASIGHAGVEVSELGHDLLHVHLVVLLVVVLVHGCAWLLPAQVLIVGVVGLLQLALDELLPVLGEVGLLQVLLHFVVVLVLLDQVSCLDHEGHVTVTNVTL